MDYCNLFTGRKNVHNNECLPKFILEQFRVFLKFKIAFRSQMHFILYDDPFKSTIKNIFWELIFDQKSTPSWFFFSKLLHWGHASIHNCSSWHYVAVADDSQWVVIGANKPLWLKSLTFRLLCISWCMYVVWQLCYILFVCFTRFIFGSLYWTTEILCIMYVYHGLWLKSDF